MNWLVCWSVNRPVLFSKSHSCLHFNFDLAVTLTLIWLMIWTLNGCPDVRILTCDLTVQCDSTSEFWLVTWMFNVTQRLKLTWISNVTERLNFYSWISKIISHNYCFSFHFFSNESQRSPSTSNISVVSSARFLWERRWLHAVSHWYIRAERPSPAPHIQRCVESNGHGMKLMVGKI